MIGCALVGLGWWGRTILALLARSRKLKVVRKVDPFVRGEGVTPDLADALADPAVQAVILCTPHSQHGAQIVRAAEAGRHVYCEKPLCLTRKDAEAAVRACNASRVVLAVGHEKRFEPPIRELFRMARAGELGTLLQVEANFSQNRFLALPPDNWRLSEKEAPAGPMTATGIHLLDLAVALLGPVERAFASVKTLGSRLANGDTLALHLAHRSGAHALIGAMLATPFEGRFAVYGTGGWAEVRDRSHPEAPQGWTLTVHAAAGGRTTREFPAFDAVLANLEAFADAAEGRSPYPVPHDEMIASIAALEAVFASAKSGAVERVDPGVERR